MRRTVRTELRPAAGRSKGRVVLLHGIMSGPAAMRPLARVFSRNGWDVLNVGYPSTSVDLRTSADLVRQAVSGFAEDGVPLSFATHSMGGLVVRTLLSDWRPPVLGRVVMIAPPNGGSEVADLMRTTGVYRRLYGPAGQQLATDRSGEIPVPDYPVGVVAGTVSLQLSGYLLFDGPNDGRVSVASAGLGPDVPLVEVASSHPFVMRHRRAMRLALSFVETGSFGNGMDGSDSARVAMTACAGGIESGITDPMGP